MKTTTRLTRALPGLILTLLLATPAALDAQGRGPGAMGPARTAPRAELPAFALAHRAELVLTDEQMARLEALVEPMRAEAVPLFEEMQALRSRVRGGEITRDEARAGMEGIRERMQVVRAAHLARVHEVLTDEQRETFERLHEARRGPGRRGPAAPGGGRRGPGGGGG